MKFIFHLKLSAVLVLAFCLLAVFAAPATSDSPVLTDGQPEIADWWKSYRAAQAHKQPPQVSVVYSAPVFELAQKLQPFRERLDHLTSLKQWVLRDAETKRLLTQNQKHVLSKPFYTWDQQSLTDQVRGHTISTRLNEEKSFVAEVENVLAHVAILLPDRNPRF
ncbi:conserved hypothetical protein [Sporisorium reilianum SRZ2]|uniref:Uncharacterized protein n=1 Tax=Sporisorium reilianum (strain SRZ2) TaxID=999809 RepID=E6ZN56_SPORE|nr:conserved hypothetical protein [Sporisorium reilianum SRZ2]